MTDIGTVRTGTAGWVYEPWRGTFFPEGLVQKKELAYASSRLGTIEINATFRANQKPESFAKWAGEARDGFVFSIKGPQLVTHIKRLKNCEIELANFFASGPLALGTKLGPFVWQLPPNISYDRDVLKTFLGLLPRTAEAYVALASKADERLKSTPFLDASGVGPIRHAIETRNASFDVPQVRDLLAEHNVAQVIADTVDNPSRALTADFAYCRLQGPARPDAAGYEPADIADWAGTAKGWSGAGRDVFAYFVHEDKLHAPDNAIALRKSLGIALPGD
ncbi:hypothetical protein WH87_14675 [Devosia epidermidihirudinis]|uniref:DUF72 domain-containing protein n=1 Tax=Devosia epidermidihirudinis TaxID=1293439 RepID=A0A0F5Q4X8_9HYPH|nr:DUF72 domain-containing protein [Devosia epidermidihirudinis]KKC35962.1 hypothetical protein WH87_14675 [Devosia epidermidihirudinis]